MIFYKIALILSMTIIAGCAEKGKFQVGQCITKNIYSDNYCSAVIMERGHGSYRIGIVGKGCRDSYGTMTVESRTRIDSFYKQVECPNYNQ